MKLRLILLAVFAVSLIGMQPASARSVTENYVGHSHLSAGSQCRGGRVPENVGKVCFDVLSTDLRVRVTVDDETGPVGFFHWFTDSAGRCVGQSSDPTGGCPTGSGFHCATSGLMTVPRGSVELEIFLDGPETGPLSCLEEAVPGVGVTGTVTAAFS